MNYININVNIVDQNRNATLNENMIAVYMRTITQKLRCTCSYPLSI